MLPLYIPTPYISDALSTQHCFNKRQKTFEQTNTETGPTDPFGVLRVKNKTLFGQLLVLAGIPIRPVGGSLCFHRELQQQRRRKVTFSRIPAAVCSRSRNQHIALALRPELSFRLPAFHFTTRLHTLESTGGYLE